MARNGLNSEPGTGGSVAGAGGGIGAVDGVKAHRGMWILRVFGRDFEPREAFDAILGGILDPQRPLALFEGGF